ncbi:hypothetical protein ACFLU4_09295, partial [Chloroflexota bacterium]
MLERGVYNKDEEWVIEQVKGISGTVKWVDTEWTPDNMYPVENRLITADIIRNYVNAVGDFNPLYRDEEYA